MIVLNKDLAHQIFDGVRVRGDPVKMGFPALDETAPLRKGDLMFIGARPRMGLTAFCLNLAARLAVSEGKKVIYFWGDQPGEGDGALKLLAERMVGIAAGVSYEMLRKHELRPYELESFQKAAEMICSGNIMIDSGYGCCPGVFDDPLTSELFVNDADVIIIDSLQGMDLGAYEGKPLSAVKHACYELKRIARENDVAIIVTYKVGKEAEIKRADHRPSLSFGDMSVAKSTCVDLAGFLYRDGYYNPNTEDKGMAELIIEKGSKVPMRTVINYRFDPENHRFFEEGYKKDSDIFSL